MWGSVNVPGGTTQGLDGKSAYEVAIANGFSGTEAQWLASLKGVPTGGAAGQVPVKVDETDYNMQWKTLEPADVNAAAAIHHHSVIPFGGYTQSNISLATKGSSAKNGVSIGEDCHTPARGIAGGSVSATGSCGTLFLIKSYDRAAKTITLAPPEQDVGGFSGNYYFPANTDILLIYKNNLFKSFYFELVQQGTPNAGGDTLAINKISNSENLVPYAVLNLNESSSSSLNNEYGIALGVGCLVSGGCGSVAAGYLAEAYSHHVTLDPLAGGSISIGCGTITMRGGQTACGSYNKKPDPKDTATKFIVGSGTGWDGRANCFRATTTGVYANGSYNATGADYAELFEWLDGNPQNEDRIGLFVTLDGEKARLANPGDDFILGVVSGNPSVVGDAYDDQWQGMYATDIFGRFIYEDAVIPAEYDEEGNLISEEHTETRLKINPAYNANEPYVPRSQRREWVTVGMMGKLTVIDDGTCQVNGWCTVGAGGVATASDSRTKYRVMSRLDGNHVRVLIL